MLEHPLFGNMNKTPQKLNLHFVGNLAVFARSVVRFTKDVSASCSLSDLFSATRKKEYTRVERVNQRDSSVQLAAEELNRRFGDYIRKVYD